MKLLVVGHLCVVDSNQALYNVAERLTGWSLIQAMIVVWHRLVINQAL